MKTSTLKKIKLVGLILTLITAISHFSTYFYFSTIDYVLLIVLLFLGTFALFGIAFSLQKEVISENHILVFWREILVPLPKFFRITVPVLFFYVIFNFFYSLSLNQSCSPEINEGKYTLEYRGEVKKIITKQEFYQHRAYEFRALSGHILLFQYVSFVILLSVVLKREKYL